MEQKLVAETDAAGQSVFTPARSLGLLVFYAFAIQCTSTMAVVYRETRSLKWPLLQLGYMTSLACLAAFAVFHLLR